MRALRIRFISQSPEATSRTLPPQIHHPAKDIHPKTPSPKRQRGNYPTPRAERRKPSVLGQTGRVAWSWLCMAMIDDATGGMLAPKTA